MNHDSSRSHAILQLNIIDSKKSFGKVSFIDLAGNERGADTYDQDKQTRYKNHNIHVLTFLEWMELRSTNPFLHSKNVSVLWTRTRDTHPLEDLSLQWFLKTPSLETVKQSWLAVLDRVSVAVSTHWTLLDTLIESRNLRNQGRRRKRSLQGVKLWLESSCFQDKITVIF